jgi:hypothetical protein
VIAPADTGAGACEAATLREALTLALGGEGEPARRARRLLSAVGPAPA